MPGPRIANISCIVLKGSDAREFAQAQFAGNVAHLTRDHWQWNAWLTVQGRVRLLLHLADPGDGRLMAIARGGNANEACTLLARYLLRTDATLTVQSYAAYASGPLAMGAVVTDVDAITLGYGTRSLELHPLEGLCNDAADPAATRRWRIDDIYAGWPWLPDGDPRWLPPALGLEHLAAIAFDKGCYPGQEIAARLHYRGGHKRRLYHLQGAVPLPLGTLHDVTGEPVDVLDCIADTSGYASLVIAKEDCTSNINILRTSHKIVSGFDA